MFRLQYLNCSAYKLPFTDGGFDLVFTKSVLVVLNHGLALAEWWRILKPGGHLVLIENMGGGLLQIYRALAGSRGSYHYWTRNDIERLSLFELAKVEHKEFHLLTTAFSLLPDHEGVQRWLVPIVRALGRVDSCLLKAFPGLRDNCYIAAIVSTKG